MQQQKTNINFTIIPNEYSLYNNINFPSNFLAFWGLSEVSDLLRGSLNLLGTDPRGPGETPEGPREPRGNSTKQWIECEQVRKGMTMCEKVRKT